VSSKGKRGQKKKERLIIGRRGISMAKEEKT